MRFYRIAALSTKKEPYSHHDSKHDHKTYPYPNPTTVKHIPRKRPDIYIL